MSSTNIFGITLHEGGDVLDKKAKKVGTKAADKAVKKVRKPRKKAGKRNKAAKKKLENALKKVAKKAKPTVKKAGDDDKPFKAFVKNVGISNEMDSLAERGWGGSRTKGYFLQQYWCTGGMEGGSCWGGEAKPFIETPKPEEMELHILDELLLKYWPELTFIQYKVLKNKLIKSYSWSDSDYYGNSSNYSGIEINLFDLYQYLKKHGKVK